MATSQTPPHFNFPFSFDTSGNVNVAQQDTPAEIASCVANVVSCPVGYRQDSPDFGITLPEFQRMPLDTSGIVGAAQAWEPRANLTARYGDQVSIDAVGQGTRSIPGGGDETLPGSSTLPGIGVLPLTGSVVVPLTANAGPGAAILILDLVE